MSLLRRAFAVTAVVLAGATAASFGVASPAGAAPAFTKTETITRTHWVNGADAQVDSRTVTVAVSTTDNLRDRQAVTVTWQGAHPTGGLVTDHNSAAAATQEYPVVVMQCRGTDSTSAPEGQRVSPQTCWTQTPDERFQYSQSGFIYPAYRMDRYAPTEDRASIVGQPNPLPAGCTPVAIPHWVPFQAADGTIYPGGSQGCAGLAPEAANAADSLQPGNTTYGVANAHGDGSTKFVVQNADSNASLGCSATVACTIEVIPIIGISCDAAGNAADAADRGMPVNQRPSSSLVPTVFSACSKAGHFPPGSYNGGGEVPDLAVSGALWWAASNWQNRVAVPITLAPSASVCDVVNNKATAYLYGSEAMLQATQQWAPRFCLDASSFSIRHVQTSEPQAKNLLRAGTIEAAIQGAPPDTPFPKPTVQAPAAVTGFAIAFSIDDATGAAVQNLKLNARLLAKLLSESYLACGGVCFDFTSDDAKSSGFAALANNPIDMSRDPEFRALNPGIAKTVYIQPAAALAVMSSDSDVMHALTSYIDADPEARAWLDGNPDPWGMVVNPAYRGIQLPVDNWPQLDTHIAQLASGANLCLTADPVPWLPLVSSPVLNPATVALNMQFDIANSQIVCKNNGAQNQKLTAIGREASGSRFLVGLVSLADAVRYQLDVASLQTHNTNTGTAPFTDAGGRTFVAPSDASMKAAAALLWPDTKVGSWVVPYGTLHTDARGIQAYPGTMLMSIDVPTSGLPKSEAAQYSSLLQFVAGAGQAPGLGNGQLPPGYLPLTSANGLATQAKYTRSAAAAVAAQRGVVPLLSGDLPAVTGTPPSVPQVPAGGGSVGSVGNVPGSSASSSSAVSPVTSTPKRTVSPTASPTSSVAAAPVARTSRLSAGPLGLALPVLAILGIASLGTAAWLSGAGRR